jgi:hypothetical protein
MSTALRIAAVTQVLKDLLNNGMIDHNVSDTVQGSIAITAWPPDKIETTLDKEITQLNIFMYQVTYNQGWRNVAQPAFNQQGERVSNPPLGIDLHYLLTAYGSHELHTDILLGYGMQILHERAVLDRDAIRRSIAPPSMFDSGSLPDSLKKLSTSELADQVEQIKITPEILSIEDISKLWAAFGAKYRPTAAYKVSVVLIESTKSIKQGLPVLKRKVYVNPFKQPVIEKIMSQSAPVQPVVEEQKILTGYRLFLIGYQLAHEEAGIKIDGLDVDKIAANLVVEDTQASLDLPPDLSSGLHEIQVIHPVLMGSPPVAHSGVISKSATFVLSPDIVSNPDGSVTTVSTNGLLTGPVTFKISPAVNPGQKVIMLLNETENTGTPLAYSFQMPVSAFLSPPQPVDELSITIKDVKKAKYLVRIKVDDAVSPLQADGAGKFISPLLDLS